MTSRSAAVPFLLVVITVALFVPRPAVGLDLEPIEGPVRVAFVHVGPVGDGGWTYAHDRGRAFMEKQMGDNVVTRTVESVHQPDAERVFTQLANQGYDLIFGTTFGYMDPMMRVAKEFPNTVFMHVSGYKSRSNMGNYLAKMYQPTYLAGIVAGHKTENDYVGFVAAHPIPPVIRLVNAFSLGVHSVNPDATVRVIWSNTWYDPAKEKEAAQSLLEQGADVIAQYQDSPAPLQAAAENGAFGIGMHSDMRQFAPDAFLTAPVWHWGPYYTKIARAVKNGTWKSTEDWIPMSRGAVGLAPMSDLVPIEAKQDVEDARVRIMSGIWDVFTGPIRDQSGTLRASEGERIPNDKLRSMEWLIEGVEGSLE